MIYPETKLKCVIFLFKNSLRAGDIYVKCAHVFTITINIVYVQFNLYYSDRNHSINHGVP